MKAVIVAAVLAMSASVANAGNLCADIYDFTIETIAARDSGVKLTNTIVGITSNTKINKEISLFLVAIVDTVYSMPEVDSKHMAASAMNVCKDRFIGWEKK